jgi:O-acetyl-ADP-ribose deacetylase (regulator of RNase III)
VAIRDAGQRAEVLNGAQSKAQAAGGAASADVLTAFVALQTEYKAIMAVVKAVQGDLTRAEADAEVVSAIDKILVNEAEVALRSVADGVDADGKATTKKSARKKVTQEALRAEIARDAVALAGLKAVSAALTKRKVTPKRLTALAGAAAALAGKLADRTVSRADARLATKAESEAVAAQRAM